MIRCKRNGKFYVGQTWETVEHRLQRHTAGAINKNSAKCPKLYNAIRFYGKENFTAEKIDEAYTQTQADMLEDFYILAANSIEKGYNVKRGGSTGKHSEASKKKIGDSKRGIARRKKDVKKMSDTKIREGTHRGVNHGKAILNEKKVREIRRLHKHGGLAGKLTDIGLIYGVSPQVIYRVVSRKSWTHVK